MTADEYATDGTPSPADRTRSGDGPVVGIATGREFAPAVPTERFDADRAADRRGRGVETARETLSSIDTEELRHV